MTIDIDQFRELIVRPTLQDMQMHSPVAENLLMGTAAQESDFCAIRQRGGGPARGMFQIEPATASDILLRYLPGRPDIQYRFDMAVNKMPPFRVRWESTTSAQIAERLIYDLRFSTAVARLRYWMVPEAMPTRADDIQALARYYKKHYNTPLGAATEAEFISKYRKYLR